MDKPMTAEKHRIQGRPEAGRFMERKGAVLDWKGNADKVLR